MGGADDKSMREAVAAKLNPARVRMSERMSSILGHLLGEDFGGREITSMAQADEGKLVMSWAGGESVALESDMVANIEGISKVAGLSPAETAWLLGRLPGRP